MIPLLDKTSLRVGSAADCELRLGGPGVAAHHARIELHDGSLVVIHEGEGTTTVDGESLAAGVPKKFSLRSEVKVGDVAVPLSHPALSLLLMTGGNAPPDPTGMLVGRDANRCHIVIQHQSVSGLHARVTINPLTITDLGSSSGTWVGQEQLPPNQARQLEPHALLSLGPVVVQAALLQQLAQGAEAHAQSFIPAPPQPTGAAAPPGTGVEQAAPPGPGPAAGAAANGSPGRTDAPSSVPKHRTVVGQVQLSPRDSSTKSIGRTPDNDIIVSHPQVSSHHATLHRDGAQLFIEDNRSANGTYVRGQRIRPGEKVSVENGEKVFVGPVPLLLQIEDQSVALVMQDQARWAGRPLYEIEAWDLLVQVPDRDNPSVLKTLIDHVSFKALPGDLIALMGPSGAGKTTLLLALNGYLPPSQGQVRINGEDLYAIYDALRGSIGYVPQDDIVHPELTVWEAVRYSAMFRLPPDYTAEEIDQRVDTTLRQLGLDSVKHLQIGKPENKILSGGQRKRVNIAMELVTDPIIMFLDEPTSGLAADDTTALVELLSDLAKDTGKTIITTIHQPAKDEFQKFNLALVLGTGGIPIFYGPTSPDAYRFFGSFLTKQGLPDHIDNPRDMFAMLHERERPIFESLRERDPTASRQQARELAAREWNAEYFDPRNPTFQKMYSGSRSVGVGSQNAGLPRGRSHTRGQFGLLLSRYFRVKARDVGGTAIMLLQAPIIGALLALVFAGQKAAIPYWCVGALQELGRKVGEEGEGADLLTSLKPTPDHTGAINFLVIAAIWFGTSNAAREIVKERAVYLRERMVNLSVFNYVFSKFLLLSLFCVIQCTVLLTIVFFSLGFHGGIEAFAIELGTLTITAMNSVALGLLLSTVVMSSEAAMALTPIALIPQIVLGGLMVPMTTNPLLKWPMYVMPGRWGFEGVVAQERLAIQNSPAWNIPLESAKSSAQYFVHDGHFQCALAQMASTDYTGAWGFVDYNLLWLPSTVMASLMFATLIAILVILKRRDRI